MATMMIHLATSEPKLKISKLGDYEKSSTTTLKIDADGVECDLFMYIEQVQELSDLLIIYLAKHRAQVAEAAQAEKESSDGS